MVPSFIDSHTRAAILFLQLHGGTGTGFSTKIKICFVYIPSFNYCKYDVQIINTLLLHIIKTDDILPHYTNVSIKH